MRDQDTSLDGPNRRFPSTAWSMVSSLLRPEQSQASLESLCRAYWKPVYCYLRRARKAGNQDAKDLTQAFFLWLLEGDVLQKFAPGQSSFRTYLIGVLRNFALNEERALRRLKRGGGVQRVPLDDLRDVVADSREESPEDAFERAWVDELIRAATAEVRERYTESGKAIRYRAYEEYDLAASKVTYALVGQALGLSESDVRNSLFAVREHIREAIRRRLRETVRNGEQLEEEWAVFRG